MYFNILTAIKFQKPHGFYWQWRSGGGRGWCPLAETLPPSCPPNEITFCTEVYGEPPFWVPVSPPRPQGFFPGGTGGPPIRRKFYQSPHPTLVPVLDQGLSPPQPRFVPENLKNLDTFLCQIWLTFKLKSTLKSCISCLK